MLHYSIVRQTTVYGWGILPQDGALRGGLQGVKKKASGDASVNWGMKCHLLSGTSCGQIMTILNNS